ncbi:MAG TPA: ABC transporter permease [Gemmatimonadales bacterium]|nr:ABC transporter permease [Gemmatimonadales bacterium]
MTAFRRLRSAFARLLGLATQNDDDARMQEEMAWHLERKAEQLREQGLPPDEARRRAGVSFGARAAHQEAARDQLRAPWADHLLRDLRYALRTLFRTPFVTTVAVLSLALGIGATSAIFSLFDEVLLRPLPVQDPGRLVNLSAPGPKPGYASCGQAGDCQIAFSYLMFRDLEQRQDVFSDLAAHVPFGASVAYQDQPVTGDAVLVSGSYFPALGIHPALGRLLSESDDQSIGTNFVAVLSYAYWQSRLGGDRAVLGKPIVVNGQALTIVGVTGPGFEGTTLGLQPLVYVPLTMQSVVISDAEDFQNRRDYWIYAFARLKRGMTLQGASAGLNGLYHSIITQVEVPLQQGMSDATMAQFREKKVVVEPGARGQSTMHQSTSGPFLMLFGVTAIVLLIACANIANLLLARGAGRAMEMGLRMALGSSRTRLIAQLLVESLVLACLGGLAGLLVAKWTLSGIASLIPPDTTGGLAFTLQPPVLLFSAALTVATGIAFGLFPAWHNTRGDLVTTIRANAGHISGAQAAARFRSTLVTLQVSLATALLIAAGLFMKSLANVAHVDLGVHIDSVVTFRLSPERAGYTDPRTTAYYARVGDALADMPSVTSVTSSNVPLFADQNRGRGVTVQGFPSGPDVDNGSSYNLVGTNYFSTLGVHLIAGREFTDADRRGALRVGVVNQSFVKKFNLGSGALGKYFSDPPDTANILIVGVVPDVKYSQVKASARPVFYLPWRQRPDIPSMSFYIRTPRPDAVLRSISGVVRKVDPGVPVENLKTLAQQVRDNVFLDRMISLLSTAFAVLATLLAAVGLYGVLAYAVAQRTREIGVRMALGADTGRVRAMVLRQVGGMMVIGSVIGLAGAVLFGRAAGSLLFGLKGTDPAVFGLSIMVLTLVALAAGYLPARRASRIDPIKALRYE